jgi:hypothetical protein
MVNHSFRYLRAERRIINKPQGRAINNPISARQEFLLIINSAPVGL